MKKTLSIFLCLILTLSLFAGVKDNGQKIFDVKSDEYDAITYLYISEGKALPSTAGPWSAAELKMMLSKIDRNSLSGYSAELYDWVAYQISPESARFKINDGFSFTISGDVGLRAGYHTNAKDFNRADDAFTEGTGDWNKQLPLISVPFETYIGSNIYGYSSFDLGINRSLVNFGSDVYNPIGYNLMTNIIMVPPVVLTDLNLNFPFRAFGSLGGDWWNIEIGRDNLSWGGGESGNLILGDQLPYHNQLRFTAFNEAFKYTFVTSFFPHPSNYVTEGTPDQLNLKYDQHSTKEGTKAFIGHRIEWTIADKLGMAINETIMYQSENNWINPIFFSPTAIFHNYYIRGNANSILGFEIDWTVMDGLNIYGQVIIDEFKLPGEFETIGPPSAFGFLLGTKTSIPLAGGMLYGSLEGVYTDPWLYIRDDGYRNVGKYGVDYIVAFYEFAEGSGQYDLNHLGYRYGNDSVVANLNVGYKVFGKWFVDATFRYMAQGCLDMNTICKLVVEGGPEDPMAPSSSHPDSGSFLPGSNWASRNAVSHTITASLKGGITLFNNFDITATLTYIDVTNFKNIKGQKANDLQVEVAAVYSF